MTKRIATAKSIEHAANLNIINNGDNMTTSEKDQYISELQMVDDNVKIPCSLIGCYKSDAVTKDKAIDIISSTWPYNDYICESCYNKLRG